MCRYWRAVALDCRELWSTITFQKYEFTDLCLARSRDLPLAVVVRDLPYEDGTKQGQWAVKLKHAFSQTDRIYQLDLKPSRNGSYNSNQSRSDTKTLCSYFQGSPNRLQSLSLDCSSSVHDGWQDDLLREGAPSLTRMCLVKTAFTWNIPTLGALTHLTITETQGRGYWNKRPEAEAFAAGLRCLPRIEVLEITDAIPRGVPELPTTVSPPVELPLTLRILNIVTPANEIKQFFQLVLVPRSTWITLKFNSSYHQPRHVDECLATLSNSWKDEADGAPRNDLSSMSIADIHKTSRRPGFELSFLQHRVDISGISHPILDYAKLTVEFAESPVPVYDIFKSIGKCWDLQTVQYFIVENTWSLPSTTYAEMLQSMPSLLVINLRKTWMKYLDAMTADPALQNQQGHSDSTEKLKPYCPGLEVLHFHLTDFNEHDVAEPQLLHQILQLYEKRAEEYGLQRLIISVATNFDHTAGWAVTECFQRIGMLGMEYMWDGSVHMRAPAHSWKK